MIADGRLGAERLAPVFEGDAARVFLREAGEAWTVGRRCRSPPTSRGRCPPTRAAGGRSQPLDAVRRRLRCSACGARAARRSDRPGARPRAVRVEAPRRAPPCHRACRHRRSVGRHRRARDRRRAASPRFPAAADPEVAFFTSGSTGEPKIVRKKACQLGEQHGSRRRGSARDGPVTVRVARSRVSHPRLHLRVLDAGRRSRVHRLLARRLSQGGRNWSAASGRSWSSASRCTTG